METLQEQVDKLLCNAFIGVCHSVERGSELSWHLIDDEERMQTIDDLITELEQHNNDSEDLSTLKSLQNKGITEVVLIRGWS